MSEVARYDGPRVDDRTLRLVRSEGFARAFVWAFVLCLLGVPLLLECAHHVRVGNVGYGCWVGGLGLLVAVGSGWRFTEALRRARRAYRESVAARRPASE